MNLSEDQILLLAPDEASKKSGRDLASPSKWVTKGVNETALWGECQGSGSKPYQTQIDLTDTAFKCSCPSRKFPCKHGIGLALLYARQPGLFTDTESPAWVADWISKRSQKQEKKSEKIEKEPDEAAQAKRQQNREQKVADGIQELLTWIKDIVRNGIINLPEKNYSYWESMSKRLIDAQAPGLASMVKGLPAVNFFEEGWQSRFMDQLLNIYIVAKAYQNKENTNAIELHELRNWIGFTVNQEELKEQSGITDNWLVLGKQVTTDEQLTVERNWLYGLNTNRYGLILQFIIRGQGAQILLSPGMYVQAELVFFPSLHPMRALIKRQINTTASIPKQLLSTWNQVSEMETEICSQFPVRTERPYVLESIVPVLYNNQWWLKDNEHNLVMIKNNFQSLYKLLALSGGASLNMAVVGKEKYFEPIGVWDQGNYKAL